MTKTSNLQVEVQTKQGIVRGLSNTVIYSFKGIPYAAPITGIDRWRPPQPPLCFNEPLDTTDYGEICPQYNGTAPSWILSRAGKALMGLMEDSDKHPQGPNCLNLNIWTKSLDANKKLPVMVFIHGGGLSIGSGADPICDGTSIAKQDAVFVSFNYRLGLMGFLAGDDLFKDDVLVGNRGFMDSLAVLRWIKENISQFGGDPNNITVVGQSGGGTALWALLASPQSEGLMHRAIVMSGPINMVSIEDQRALTREVLKKLKVAPGDTKALADVTDDQAKSAIAQTLLFSKGGDAFGEMSRTKLPATGAYGTKFMPKDVLEALENGRSNNIDIMVGSCKHDGRVSHIALPLPSNWGVRIMNYMVAGVIGKTKEDRKKILRKYQAVMTGTPDTLVREQIQTDALYRVRALKAGVIHSKSGTGKTYSYQFNWESPVAGGALGALHGMDIPFALDNLLQGKSIVGNVVDAQPLADAMSEAFVNFAKNGEPSSSLLPLWPEYEEDARQTMVFNSVSEVQSDPDSATRKIWS